MLSDGHGLMSRDRHPAMQQALDPHHVRQRAVVGEGRVWLAVDAARLRHVPVLCAEALELQEHIDEGGH